jgi:hypothetical protein
MTPRLARWLVRLYPRDWRERYGEEFDALLQDGSGGFRAVVNVLRSALSERVVPAATLGVVMHQYPNSVLSLSKKPSAFVPMVMSFTALAVLLGSIAASSGVVRETDEGAIAHIWQLLMAGQLPIVAYFVIRWLPRVPRRTLYVLALQIGAALAALAPVYFLGL